jgi:sulfate transport system substrate-binding protein
MIKPSTVFLASLISIISTASLSAAGCCEGFGSPGLEGEWQASASQNGPKTVEIFNASIETSRDLFAELNKDFSLRWLHKTGYVLTIQESHGSSEAQSRAILHGSDPDLVSLDNPAAIDELSAKGKLLPEFWQARLPDNSAPYTTTIVFLVDKGNPKKIRDWNDLTREGVSVITPNPKTSSRGQWNYFAAWAQAVRATGSTDKAREFIGNLYHNVPVLNSSGRGAVETYLTKRSGDVLLVWESDAKKLIGLTSDRQVEIVTPSSSILVEPPVAYLDTNIEKHGTARVTISFAQYLFKEPAQEIFAKHFFRPRDKAVAEKYSKQFPALTLLTVADIFGSWEKATEQHFSDGGIFDTLGVQEKVAELSPSPTTTKPSL